jgi:hypothetical protein
MEEYLKAAFQTNESEEILFIGLKEEGGGGGGRTRSDKRD